MSTVPLYRGAAGLVNKLDSARAPYNAETGVLAFTQADNVVFDITGAASRRAGYTLLTAGVVDSVFSCGDYGLCYADGYLCLITGGLTLTQLTTLYNPKVAYARSFSSKADLVYFSDGLKTGIVRGGVYEAWTVQPYVGVNSTKARLVKFETVVPSGHILAIYNGRMLIAKDNRLWVSEYLAFSWFNAQEYYQFRSRIVAIKIVPTGIYVSTDDDLFFMPGENAKTLGMLKVYSPGVIKGTDVSIPAVLAKVQARGEAFFFAVSGRGICSADENGIVTNYTESVIDFPESKEGSAYISDDGQYIVSVKVPQ